MFDANNIKKLDPAVLLRIGLGGTMVYAGTSIIANTQAWLGFTPQWILNISPIDGTTLLIGHGVFELILGLLLVFGVFLRLSSLVAFFDLLFIVVFIGVDLVTFRDFGLLMAALALFVLVIRSEQEEQS